MSTLIIFVTVLVITLFALVWEWRQIPKREKEIERAAFLAAAKRVEQAFVDFGKQMASLREPLRKAGEVIRTRGNKL